MVELESDKKDLDMITRAHLAAERLERANKLSEELVKRQEALEARRLLAGESSAGFRQEPELSDEEKVRIGMKTMFKGTIIEARIVESDLPIQIVYPDRLEAVNGVDKLD
jgi:hypothetical protein